jgi:hypothetical protein
MMFEILLSETARQKITNSYVTRHRIKYQDQIKPKKGAETQQGFREAV